MASSGAEQDRYAAHFDSGSLPSARQVSDAFPTRSGAEQDIYGSHLSGNLPSARDISSRVPQGSGAEQDVYGGWFGGKSVPVDKMTGRLPRGSGAEQDRLGAHFEPGRSSFNPTAIGLLQTSVLPSFGLHAGLGALAYGISRYTDHAAGKDWLWPTGMTANAWWSAIGTRVVYDGLSIPQAWSTLNYSEKLLLTGVSAWGLRLFYCVATRHIKQGSDDPRYTEAKKDPKFWNKAFFSLYMPEAVAQTLISLPFTLPFRATLHSAIVSPAVGDPSIFHNLAVFLFSAGFALEVLADSQLDSHKKKNPEALNREGVWSIVRHPNYLGDALIHASFPLLLLGAGLLHPIALVGPVVNYAFLRYVGGDKQNEEFQEARYKSNPVKYAEFCDYRKQKNSFWPSLEELQNKWTWIVVAAGAGGVIIERGARMLF